MCCFSGSIKYVHWTKIFGRLSGRGTQYLAYQMAYESERENAMILPLPVKIPAREDSVRFIDLSSYEDFFHDLAFGFPTVTPSLGCGTSSGLTDDLIETQKIGNFIASFVPSVEDFKRLDPQFAIPKETWDKIPTYADYGFAVFQLHELAGRPHPMAFEFETRLDKTFFPTVHIHDGQVHEAEDFDHVLYMQHAGLDSCVSGYSGPYNRDRLTKLVRSKTPASQFCSVDATQGIVAPELLIHKSELEGTLPNKDVIFTTPGSPTVRTFNYREWTWLFPWLFGIGIAGWFLRRRERLRRNRA